MAGVNAAREFCMGAAGDGGPSDERLTVDCDAALSGNRHVPLASSIRCLQNGVLASHCSAHLNLAFCAKHGGTHLHTVHTSPWAQLLPSYLVSANIPRAMPTAI